MAQFDFTIGEVDYRADKLVAMQQLHVSRRIGPLIPTIIPIALTIMRKGGAEGGDTIMRKGGAEGGDTIKAILSNPAVLQPFADALATIPDGTLNYIFDECLSVVKRNMNGAWVRIWDKRTHDTLSDDVGDMETLLPIVVKVITENLGPFIRGLLTSQGGTPVAAP